MLALHHLGYAISGNSILRDVNWQIECGQHSLLLGLSGSGKTTLLHLMAGLLLPSSGEISFKDKPLPNDWRVMRLRPPPLSVRD